MSVTVIRDVRALQQAVRRGDVAFMDDHRNMISLGSFIAVDGGFVAVHKKRGRQPLLVCKVNQRGAIWSVSKTIEPLSTRPTYPVAYTSVGAEKGCEA